MVEVGVLHPPALAGYQAVVERLCCRDAGNQLVNCPLGRGDPVRTGGSATAPPPRPARWLIYAQPRPGRSRYHC